MPLILRTLLDSMTAPRARGDRPTPGDLLALIRQRRALARMDAAQLTDLGLTRAQALAEAARPVWDWPAHWR